MFTCFSDPNVASHSSSEPESGIFFFRGIWNLSRTRVGLNISSSFPRPLPSHRTVDRRHCQGTFVAELYMDRMPITVSNFVDLVKLGFYDGLHFHRVIDGFMLQFGCPHAKNPKAPNSGQGGRD